MKRGALLLAAVVLAGCGGSSKQTPADPGREAMDRLVTAAAQRDAKGIWELLAPSSQKRLGPTLESFESGRAKVLEKQLAPFTGGAYATEVSQLVTTDLGVVAIRNAHAVFAAPLARRADGELKFVLGGPVGIALLGPKPGPQADPVLQIAVEAHGASDADLWLDGVALLGRGFGAKTSATVFANLPARVPKGRHVVVAFAHDGRGSAAALAWAFTVG